MQRVLIIDDNMIVSHAIQTHLELLGYTIFDHAWTEEQAVTAAVLHQPDLIVVGDGVEAGCGVSAARRIALETDVPVLMVSADPVAARRRLNQVANVEGPFRLDEIEDAVHLARSPGA